MISDETRPGRERLHDVVTYWAARRPLEPAIIHHDRGQTIDWSTFEVLGIEWAKRLLALGFRRGDIFATSLPFFAEHILLEYACFRIGVILAPLDLRLRPAEVRAFLGIIRPKGYAGLPELCELVRAECAFVEWITPLQPGGRLPSAAVSNDELRRAENAVTAGDGALIVFTTGSTGSPKAALLSHGNITCQNLCLGDAFEFREGMRVLVNLPPSHVGGQTEALMTTLFYGGTAVVLDVFDAARSLAAIRAHRVDLIGQIPAMFQLEWRHPDFASADLSSLSAVLYGGQLAPVTMLEKMALMAPRLYTGLGLTEAAGFCTYTPGGANLAAMASHLGSSMPVYPMSIRAAMREDGAAGAEVPDGEVGHVCFRGPQTFLGYINDPEATAHTISSDGFLYTGDLGLKDPNGLQLAGRAKWIIKPAGYLVFPGDVEAHIVTLDGVAACGVAGAPHRTLTEAIVAFVERKPGAELSVPQLRKHARALASYMRPLHYVLLEQGQLPMNRTFKTDYVLLARMATDEIERLRAAGRWDQ